MDTMTPNSTDQGNGWDAAAQPTTPAPTAAPANPQAPPQSVNVAAQPGEAPQASATPSTSSQSQIAAAPAPEYTAPPRILTPLRPGIMGVVDKIVNALAGTNRPELAKDQEGNTYVKNTSLSRGEQWQRLAGTALVGAAKGFAAGRGAGHMGDAAAAGVDAGAQIVQQRQQQEKDMTQEARQQTLDAANHQLLVQKVAMNALTLAGLKAKATEDDIDWSEKQRDYLEGHGGTLLGYAKDGKELAQLMLKTPDFNQNHIQKSLMQPVTIYNPDHTAAGMAVYQMKPGTNDQMAPPGTTIYTYDAVNDKLVPQKTSDPKPMMDIFSINNAAHAQQLEARAKVATTAHVQAQTAAEQASAAATAAKTPSEIARNRAEAANANASATEHLSKAKQQEEASGPLVDQIGLGKVVPERLSYLLSRNPALLQAVTDKYPDFDGGKAQAYPKVYDQFTSTKPNTAGYALNAGATALKHLQKLKQLNTVASHIPGTPAYRAYQTQLDDVAPELAKFYGDSTIPGIASYRKDLGSTLPGNRDSAIATQTKALGEKFDSYEQQWKNAAPSKYYEAPMPNVDEKAMEARAALDPDFRARRVAEQGGPGPVAIQPNETVYTNPQTKQQVVLRGNKYVDVKTGAPVQ